MTIELTEQEARFLQMVLESWSPARGPEKVTKQENQLTDSIIEKLECCK